MRYLSCGCSPRSDAATVQGRICNSPCTAIRWVPNSPNLFLVSHADGSILVYDKEREDGAFIPHEPTFPPPFPPSDNSQPTVPAGEWNPLDTIFVTMPPWHPSTMSGVKGEKEKTAKNPVSHWKVSRRSVVGRAICYVYLCSVL